MIRTLKVSSRLVLFNSHGRRRQELVTFKVSKPDVLVYVMATIEDEEEEEEAVPTQISPVFGRESGELLNTEFQITFLATVPALGMQTYFVRQVLNIPQLCQKKALLSHFQLKTEDGENEEMSVATVRIFNTGKHPFQVS